LIFSAALSVRQQFIFITKLGMDGACEEETQICTNEIDPLWGGAIWDLKRRI
jgi:hypothetical protein